MAIFAATDYTITLGGTDWSDWVTSVSLPISVNVLDTAAFGDTWMEHIGGLKSFQCQINFHQDFVDNGLDETIFAALGTSVALTVKATSSSTSAANPLFSGSVLISEWNPINASVGDLAQVSVTWPGTGTLSRATS